MIELTGDRFEGDATMESDGFARWARGIRVIEKALGDGVKNVRESERLVIAKLRRNY